MRNYVLKLYSSYLQGHIPDEKFHIATGSGSNGKSLSIDLLMYALGEYAITLPITILIKKRNASNAASPELAMIKGKRFGVFQEPEHNDKILKQDIENWAPQFMALLIETFKDYKKNGLHEPNDVVQFTKKYQQDSDHFLEFINENIEDSDNKKDYITMASAWDTFKSWFKDVHPDVKQLPSKADLKEYMEEKFGKAVKGRWINKIMKIDEDSDDEENYDNVTTISGGNKNLLDN